MLRALTISVGISLLVGQSVFGEPTIVNPGTGVFPNGTVGTEYAFQMVYSTTNPPTHTTTTGGGPGSVLPPGMDLSDEGILFGTPTVVGTYNFTVFATSYDGSTSNSFSITINPAGEGESSASLAIADAVNFVAPVYTLGSHWYRGQAIGAGSAGGYAPDQAISGANVAQGVLIPQQNPQQNPFAQSAQVCGFLYAGTATSSTQDGYANGATQELDGCGFMRFRFIVIFKDDAPTQPYRYWQTAYNVSVGRNGYVGWDDAIYTHGGSFSATWGVPAGYLDAFQFGRGTALPITGSSGSYQSPRFPATSVLNSMINNPNGVLCYDPGTNPSNTVRAATIFGSTGAARIFNLLTKLRDSVTTKQDWTDTIPRCASQDIEGVGGGGSSTDHTLDVMPGTPSPLDNDGDGVFDYNDAEPFSALVTGAPSASPTFQLYRPKFVNWSWTGLNPAGFSTVQYPTVVFNWSKPSLGGSVAWFTTSVPLDPAANAATAVGGPLNTLRTTCRTIGAAFIVFWTLHGVLITIRQW